MDRLGALSFDDMTVIDAIDRTIIGHLATDGRMPIRELAERIALSPSATSDRVRRLEADGVIAGYAAQIDPAVAGTPIQAIVEVQLDPTAGIFEIDEAIAAMPEVIDAFHLTGRFDYQIRIATAGIEGIEHVIRHLKEELGVRETSTRVILRTVSDLPRQPGTTITVS